MCFSGVALVGGGVMLSLVVFRTLPIMREMLFIARRSESISLRVEEQFSEIRRILEERSTPLEPKHRSKNKPENAKKEEAHAQSGIPEGT
jgi:hypothetical protein